MLETKNDKVERDIDVELAMAQVELLIAYADLERFEIVKKQLEQSRADNRKLLKMIVDLKKEMMEIHKK